MENYSGFIIAAYVITFAGMAGLLVQSILRYYRIKQQLNALKASKDET